MKISNTLLNIAKKAVSNPEKVTLSEIKKMAVYLHKTYK